MAHVNILSGLTANATAAQPNDLNILVLNLMPNRAITERQITAVFAQGLHDVALTFCLPDTHHIRHHELALRQAYTSFNAIKDRHFDGLIVTGAAIDQLPFAEVDFFPELRRILTWRKTHVDGALYICWGAYAAGSIDGTFNGRRLSQKISGVYTTDGLTMPHSRHFTIPQAAVHRGQIIAGSKALGATLIEDNANNNWYLAGHLEYQTDTLRAEYYRDCRKVPTTPLPENYFDEDLKPHNTWHNDAQHVYGAWLQSLTTTTRRRNHG